MLEKKLISARSEATSIRQLSVEAQVLKTHAGKAHTGSPFSTTLHLMIV